MLEVCFQDSVKGALALAQNCGRESIGSAVAAITEKKGVDSYFINKWVVRQHRRRQMQLQRMAVPLGGKREDIVGVSFGLSEGDIQSPIALEGCPRREYLREQFFFGRAQEHRDTEVFFQKFWESCIQDFQRLQVGPPQIRVWLDATPDAQCGLLFLADLLERRDTEIHVVELPRNIAREDGCTVEYRGWGEVEPELFGTFLEKERILTRQEIRDLADRWRFLRDENSPLRVVEDGTVISAGQSYYDPLIRMEFPKESCTVAELIAGVLIRQKILTGDVFIARRIQHWLDSGELVVLESSDQGLYRTTVACGRRD